MSERVFPEPQSDQEFPRLPTELPPPPDELDPRWEDTTDDVSHKPGAGPRTGQSPAAQLTLRAVLTGMFFGGVLSLCNIYTGLKIGWSTNMSITAALLGYAGWMVWGKLRKRDGFSILETNMNQTAASAGASVSSAGLVAPIPALAMLTGVTLGWAALSMWVFSVTLVGIVVAAGLRRQMLEEDRLPFPFGVATGETLKEMYARGQEAVLRVWTLLASGAVAGCLKLSAELIPLKPWGLPGSVSLTGAAAKSGTATATLKNLGFAFSPSALFIGVGALIGIRAGVSLMLGAVIAYGVLAPEILALGYATPGAADKSWFGGLITWMLWPGVSLMVSASLTSFALSVPKMVSGILARRREAAATGRPDSRASDDVPRKWFYPALAAVMVISVTLQVGLFDIPLWVATLGVLFTFVLAIVAARVSGETGITPVGPMGKVTQLALGFMSPGNVTANLMAANVTGGAASQAGDLLHDMKTGQMLGASPRLQAIAQVFGVMAGSMVGCAAYLIMVPDPSTMLLTDEWPAPAVAQWTAVAEVFQQGLSKMPPGSGIAIIWATAAGISLAVAEKFAPARMKSWVPSATSIGLAFVIPAYYSVSMFLGALAGVVATRVAKSWSARFMVVIAAGLIVGESLTGIVLLGLKVLFPSLG